MALSLGPLTQIAGTSLQTDQSDASWLDGTWWQQLQPGSWRGVGFVMDAAENRAGRRTATHEYPYRDTVWVEDLGRLPRRFAFQAFIVGDDVYQQRDAMIQACEQPGAGTLVHPTLGSIECVLIDFSTTDRRERGRMVEVQFQFVATGDILFPATVEATQDQVAQAAGALGTASTADLTRSLGALGTVPAYAARSIAAFGDLATTAVNDPARALGAVNGLAGFFGRYAAGSRSTLLPADATVQSCLAAYVTTRQTVLGAVHALNTVAGSF